MRNYYGTPFNLCAHNGTGWHSIILTKKYRRKHTCSLRYFSSSSRHSVSRSLVENCYAIFYSNSQSSICFVVLSRCFSFEAIHFRTVLYAFAMFLSDCIVILLSALYYISKSTDSLKYYNIDTALQFPYKLYFIGLFFSME